MDIAQILSIPKTIYFNLAHLPLKQAIKFPVCVYYHTKIKMKGKLILPNNVSPFMIRIGFLTCEECNTNDKTLLSVGLGDN